MRKGAANDAAPFVFSVGLEASKRKNSLDALGPVLREYAGFPVAVFPSRSRIQSALLDGQ
jgi:hypothetical protein